MFPKEFFDVKLGTTNGTYHIVKTLQKGTTTIDGSLNSVIKAVNTLLLFCTVTFYGLQKESGNNK
ncbi:hypothetical protein DPMN_008129 [Dreissena polymorpha]|uniref:NUP210 fourth Ig-like domain-containing protein n=1 Tax=Dreissena polymorpha TaxID=45954 RepID=A0A9D4MZS7_DREPO|nr:hypothetical protein DPMN_008129 [Dreissena polymorpha]